MCSFFRLNLIVLTFVVVLLSRGYASAQDATRSAGAFPQTGNPFAGLVHETDLSPLPNAATATPAAATDLGPINAADAASMKVSLYEGIADLEGLYRFTIRTGDSTAAGKWPIYVERLTNPGQAGALMADSDQLLTEPIAHLSIRSNRLYLDRNPDNLLRFSGQLANALIELSAGRYSHSIRLRKTIVKGAIALDLTEKSIRVPLEVPDMPKKEAIKVTLDDIELLSEALASDSRFTVEPANGEVNLGKRIVVSRQDSVDTEIQLVFDESDSGSEVLIRTFYHLAGEKRRRPFAEEYVSGSYERMQRSLDDARVELSAAQSALPRIEAELRRVTNLRPRDAQEESAKKSALISLKQQRRKAASSIRRYGRAIPKTVQAIEDVQEVIEVGEELNHKVLFHISVVADDGSHTFELVRIGDSHPAGGIASRLSSTP